MTAADQAAIRVLIAEDEDSLRAAIHDLVDGEPDLEIVGAAASADETIALAGQTRPDVALVDVRMPGGGQVAVRGIREQSPWTQILALSAYADRTRVIEMLQAGVVGYLVKGITAAEIVEAIRRASRSQASLSAEVMASVVEELAADGTDRRQGEAVIRRSEEKFRGLLESSPDAVVIVDDEGRIVLVNEQTELLFGYVREELLGKRVETLLPEHLRERHVGHRAEYLAHPETRPMGVGLPLEGRRKDGTRFPVDISLSALDTEEGRLVTARVRDVTERERAEEARRKSEERFAALLESAPDAVVIIDQAGRIVLVNEQTETMFGFARSELLGEAVETLLPERFRDRHLGHRNHYFANPGTRPMGVGLDLAGRRKDGSEFPVDISLAAIETEEGRLATAFIRDITERQAQAELEQTLAERRAVLARMVSIGEEERQRIAADIHDDSIQAISAAGMRLQILRRRLDDPEHLSLLADLEETIQLSIARLRHLLFELRPPVLDQEGLSAALRMYLEEAAGHSGPTRYRLDDQLLAQPQQETRLIIYRIAQEALTNIRKHAEAENATVTLSEGKGGYLVRIQDDGLGFTAVEAGPTPGHLGLSSMRERAELAGGWLRIDSSPGKGTVVEFWIPHPTDRSGNGARSNLAHESGDAIEAA
jgi:PAS domain S-box-containing protein